LPRWRLKRRIRPHRAAEVRKACGNLLAIAAYDSRFRACNCTGSSDPSRHSLVSGSSSSWWNRKRCIHVRCTAVLRPAHTLVTPGITCRPAKITSRLAGRIRNAAVQVIVPVRRRLSSLLLRRASRMRLFDSLMQPRSSCARIGNPAPSFSFHLRSVLLQLLSPRSEATL
jgi:hypothetical protein